MPIKKSSGAGGSRNVGHGGTGGHSVANVTHHLKGISFPASKEDMKNHARKNGATEDVIEVLNAMEDREYDTMADVMKEYGRTRRAA